jgi:hypothetical protein
MMMAGGEGGELGSLGWGDDEELKELRAHFAAILDQVATDDPTREVLEQYFDAINPGWRLDH